MRRLRGMAALLLAFAAGGVSAQTITVSAASSLADAFRELAARFEKAHPDSRIQLNIGGSGLLLQQIQRGAPVDVFASADEFTMSQAQASGSVSGEVRYFAANALVLIQPLGATPQLDSIHALADAGLRRIALGNPESVPAGRYAKSALEAAGLWTALSDSLIPAQNVRQVLDYVARGEVQAGFVYATDAAQTSDRVRVAASVPVVRPIRYPIAVLNHGKDNPSAQAFVDYVLSEDGQGILAAGGFLSAE